MTDDQKDDLPPASTTKPARYGFACGTGPCKTFRVYENEPELPALPAPLDQDKAE